MRNRLRTLLTHYALRTLIVLAPGLLLYEFVSLGFALLRGWAGLGFELGAGSSPISGSSAMSGQALQAKRVIRDRDILSGGDLPLAPGLLRSPVLRGLVWALSPNLELWSIVRVAVG